MRKALLFLLFSLIILTIPNPAYSGVDETFESPDSKSRFTTFVERIIGQEVFNRSYAVVIGVGDYTNYQKLSAPAADAIRMRDFLRDEAGFDRITLLTDEKATRARIEAIMEGELPRLARPNDRVLFYFSGHGATRTLTTGERGYLILAASQKDAWETMIDMPRIGQWSENLDQARHVLFLLDACFSGLAAWQPKSGETGEETAERLIRPASHVVTAGGASESSFEFNGESIFTSLFLQGARGQLGHADNNIIGLNEIVVSVNRALDEKRLKNKAIKMTPRVFLTRLPNNDGEFFFHTSDAVAPISSTSKKDNTATEADMRRHIADLEARLAAADETIRHLQNFATIAGEDVKSVVERPSGPPDMKCDPHALPADQVGRVRIRQQVRDSGQKAANSRTIYTNSFRLAVDDSDPAQGSAGLTACILDAVDRVVYNLNPNWFERSTIESTNRSDGFQYAVGVWGTTAITATIHFKGGQKPVELKGFFSTQDGLDAFLQRPPA